jgi:hypothetical protein
MFFLLRFRLSEETKKELRKKKKILLEKIHKHERAVLQLADARMV